MTLGAEPKKLAILCGLLVVAGYLVYSNLLAPSGQETTSAAAPASKAGQPPLVASVNGAGTAAATDALAASTAPIQAGSGQTSAGPARSRESGRDNNVEEFRPTLKPREGKDRVDTTKIDPTLELFRLEQLQQVAFAGNGRNLFEFGAVPPPPVPDVKIVPKPKPVAEVKPPEPVTPAPPPPPVVPKAPPIPLKYYGYSQKDFEARTRNGGARRGLFLRGGEEIFVAAEGDIIDKRYKVIKLQEEVATMQDITFDQDRQTLPIVAPDTK